MRIEQKAEKTLLLLLNDKPAALPITAIHAVDRWGKWPLILARPCGLATSDPSVRRGRVSFDECRQIERFLKAASRREIRQRRE